MDDDDRCFLCLGKLVSPLPEMSAGVYWCFGCLAAFRGVFSEEQQRILARLIRRIADQDERIAKLERGDLGG